MLYLILRSLGGKKVPFILPVYHDNKFIVNFKENRGVFNAFFAKQCSLLDNGSRSLFQSSLLTSKENQMFTSH